MIAICNEQSVWYVIVLLLVSAVSCNLDFMNGKRTSSTVSFITAFSLIFGMMLMSIMAVSEAAASTRTEQTVADGSRGQCLVSSICLSHNSSTCFQCAQIMMQHGSSIAIFSAQGLSPVNYSLTQPPYLSWIDAIDPDPPKEFSYI